jgi:hypothetical protein
MLYLAVGFGLGTAGWGLMAPDPRQVPAILERVAEVALLISLFSVGLKLGLPLSSRQWRLPAPPGICVHGADGRADRRGRLLCHGTTARRRRPARGNPGAHRPRAGV